MPRFDAGADMVGLVFFPPSPRFVTPEQAAPLAAHARGRGAVTALTVDMDEAGIAAIVEAVRPDWLQLHGHEPPEQVRALKRRFGLPVMKVIGIREPADLAAGRDLSRRRRPAAPRRQAAQGRDPAGRQRGRLRLGRSSMASIRACRGCCRAASTRAMSARRCARSRPPGVDVSSGVESAPGRKDLALIAAFIAAARAAETAAARELAVP